MAPFPAPPDYFDEPPSYEGSICSPAIPSPSYSASPRQSEVIIRTSSEATCASSENYIYHSKHITVNLGLKLWGTSIPVYGNGGVVEGAFSLSDDPKNVSSVCVKLEGTVTNTYSERGLIAGSSSVGVLETSCNFTSPISGTWAEEQPFSLSFPENASGRQTPLPPSSILYHPGVTCRVKYRLKISVIRKGLRKNDSLKILLLYLPRTFAKGPLLPSIPDIIDHPSQPNLEEVVHRIPLRALRKGRSPDDFPRIVLSLPSILSFASNDAIPLKLIVFSQNAAISDLLLSSAKVHLVKRTRTCINGGRNGREHESLIGEARIVNKIDSRDGSEAASYTLRATRPPFQRTWVLEDIAEQQYFIRVTVSPPLSTASHLPKYECEQVIELTTDACESPEREVTAAGGLPSPALESIGLGPLTGGV